MFIILNAKVLFQVMLYIRLHQLSNIISINLVQTQSFHNMIFIVKAHIFVCFQNQGFQVFMLVQTDWCFRIYQIKKKELPILRITKGISIFLDLSWTCYLSD